MAKSQGWTVEDDASGHTRFSDQAGEYITDYSATPSRPQRRMAELEVEATQGRVARATTEQEGTALTAEEGAER